MASQFVSVHTQRIEFPDTDTQSVNNTFMEFISIATIAWIAQRQCRTRHSQHLIESETERGPIKNRLCVGLSAHTKLLSS